MKSQIIEQDRIAGMLVAHLPTRPNAPTSLGGAGYTATDMKCAFDRLPLFLHGRINTLIEDITGENGGSITDVVKTQLFDGHTLKDFFDDVKSGDATSYIKCFDSSLAEYLQKLRSDINALAEKAGVSLE